MKILIKYSDWLKMQGRGPEVGDKIKTVSGAKGNTSLQNNKVSGVSDWGVIFYRNTSRITENCWVEREFTPPKPVSVSGMELKDYNLMYNDVGNTHSINSYSHRCEAYSVEGAITKARIERGFQFADLRWVTCLDTEEKTYFNKKEDDI